jgi:hypothetical protein
MSELSKTQKLQAQRDKLNRELAVEQEREATMQDDLVSDEGMTEEAANRIVGADKFMRAVTVHMVRTRDAITRLEGTLKDLSDNGFRMCEGHKVRLQTLETSDRDQWDAIGKKMDKGGRAPRTKAAAWSVGGAGIGGGVIYAIMDWLAKHYGAGGTP